MVDVLSSTQEKRLTFSAAAKMSWDLFLIAFGLSVALVRASLFDGVNVNSTVTGPRNARDAIGNAKKLVMTFRNAQVTIEIKVVT